MRVLTRLIAWLTAAVFRSITVLRRDPEPDGPVLVLANHGGGLADILAVIHASGRFPRFLARDVIWKYPIVRGVMRRVNAIPVHRRQDHGGSADNTGMFDDAFAGLANGDLLAIYPEGDSIAEPRLATLRTGAARIALGALARGTDASIVPMGLHFYDVSVLRGRCFVDVAHSFKVSDAIAQLDPLGELGEPNEDNRALVSALTGFFHESLAGVVDEYDDWQQRREFEAAATMYLRNKRGDHHAPIAYEEMAAVAAAITASDPETKSVVSECVRSFDSAIEILGVSGAAFTRASMIGTRVATQFGLTLLFLPLALLGLIVNVVPMALVKLVTLTRMAAPTAATVKPLVAALAFPAAWAWWALQARQHWGLVGLVAAAAIGPVSLIALEAVAERLQLMWLTVRAWRRADGAVLDRVMATNQSLIDAVDGAVQQRAA